ncbi:MAG: YitT family protein [Bacteroidales bacterium]|nr:YitT family protein [Bacteroidales bacterium]
MKKLTFKQVYSSAEKWVLISIGLALFAFGWSAFLLPSQLMGGGISGIASLLYFSLKIPVGISSLVLNVALVGVGFKILGRQFSITTIICSVLLSAFFSVFQPLFAAPLVDDTFLCAMLGSMLAGFGVGIVLNNEGNTGGIDIIILVINHFRNISYGKLSMMMNVVIIGCSYFIVQSIECLVYSYVAMFAYTVTCDMVIEGHRQTYQFMIFSSKSMDISERINQELHRGATLLKGYGSYTKEEKDILLVIAHRQDKAKIIKLIKEIDNNAFISIAKTSGVFGKNFDKLRL